MNMTDDWFAGQMLEHEWAGGLCVARLSPYKQATQEHVEKRIPLHCQWESDMQLTSCHLDHKVRLSVRRACKIIQRKVDTFWPQGKFCETVHEGTKQTVTDYPGPVHRSFNAQAIPSVPQGESTICLRDMRVCVHKGIGSGGNCS